jgi:AcrR family transcriptional regulator
MSSRPRDHDGRPGGRERILAAAREVLDVDGEAALRFTDIAARADVAISVIAHHFSTREGLVAELHAQRFAGLVANDQDALAALTRVASDRDEYAAGVTQLTAQVVDTARQELRLARIVSIGAAHGRPDLAERIRDEATRLLDALTDVVIAGQATGFVDRDVDPRAIATFIQAYALGMIVADLDRTPVDRAVLAEVISRALRGLFAGD